MRISFNVESIGVSKDGVVSVCHHFVDKVESVFSEEKGQGARLTIYKADDLTHAYYPNAFKLPSSDEIDNEKNNELSAVAVDKNVEVEYPCSCCDPESTRQG